MELSLWFLYLTIFVAAAVMARAAFNNATVQARQHHDTYVSGMTERMIDLRTAVTTRQVYATTLACTIGVPLLSLLLARNTLLALAVLPVGYLLPRVVLARMERKRSVRFEDQLPEAADLISNALQTGHNLQQAVTSVTTEMDAPIADEFQTVVGEIQLGRTLPEALTSLNERMNSSDLNLLVTSLLIAEESGGDVGRKMKTIADTVRKRHGLESKIKSLTAQGRFQGVLMSLLPFLLLIVLRAVDPESMEPMFHGMGLVLLTVMVVLLVIGFFSIRKIISVDV